MKNDIENTQVEPIGPMTMAEIAQHMGVSRAQVYNIYSTALMKLKKGLEERGYSIEDLETTFTEVQEPTSHE